MDSRRADVGEDQSGQPPQRKLGLLHQRAPADAKPWLANSAAMLSGNNAKQTRLLWPATKFTPRETRTRDSDKLPPVALDEWIAGVDEALRTLTGGAHAARAQPAADDAPLTHEE